MKPFNHWTQGGGESLKVLFSYKQVYLFLAFKLVNTFDRNNKFIFYDDLLEIVVGYSAVCTYFCRRIDSAAYIIIIYPTVRLHPEQRFYLLVFVVYT